jgi:hypothetical protein
MIDDYEFELREYVGIVTVAVVVFGGLIRLVSWWL